MRTAMITLLCFISILVSVSFGFYESTKDAERIENIEMTSNAQHFYIKESDKTTDEELKFFKELSKTYQATIIRTDKIYKDSIIIYKSGLYTDDYFSKLNLRLKKGKIPKSSNEFLATYDTLDKNQVDTIKDLFDDNKLVFGSLEDLYSKQDSSVTGTYTLISDSNHDEIFDKLSIFFGVSIKDLQTQTSSMGYSDSGIYLLVLFLSLIIFAIFCLMNVFYPISKLKEIGVLKLQGYKYVDIWLILNGRILLIPVLFCVVTMIVQAILIKNISISYLVKLSFVQFCILLICLLFSLLMLIMIRKLKLSDILRNFFDFRCSLYFSYALKLLIFIGLIYSIPQLTNSLTSLIQEYQVKNVYESKKDILTLSKYKFVGDEFQKSISGSDPLLSKLSSMYLELEKTAECQFITINRIEARTLQVVNTNKWKNTRYDRNDTYTIMYANYHYVHSLGFTWPDSLKSFFDTDSLTVLVPESYKVDNDKIEYLTHTLAANYVHKNEDDMVENVENVPVNMVYYKDNNKKIFSENMDMIDKDNGFIKNPILFCLSDKFIDYSLPYLENSALSNPLRIKKTDSNLKAITTAVRNNKLSENNIQFDNILSTGFARQLFFSQIEITGWLYILSMAVLVSILSSYYIVLIILVLKKKKVLVSKLLGYSLFERYQNEVYYFSILYLFGLVEITLLSFSLITLLIYLLLILADSSIIYIMVKHHDKKSLSLALKGEE